LNNYLKPTKEYKLSIVAPDPDEKRSNETLRRTLVLRIAVSY
jgi:hypothetical protein